MAHRDHLPGGPADTSASRPSANGPTKAILRTTPALFALYSLVTLWAHELHTQTGPIRPQTAAWYDKRLPTFSDALADVRRALWWPQISSTSPPSRDPVKIHPDLLDRWIDTLCRAA